MRRLLVLSAFLSGLVLVLLLGGCSNSSEPRRKTRSSSLLVATSPENVVANLKIIYSEKDDSVRAAGDVSYWTERYRNLFHPDPSVFKFYFVTPEVPVCFPDGWWGVEDEVASFDSLLSAVVSGRVKDIRLSWNVGPSEPDQRLVPGGTALLHPDWRHIRVTFYILDVEETEILYRAMGMTDFYFGPNPEDSELWVITEWWDLEPQDFSSGLEIASGTTAPMGVGWGRMKAFYRKATCRVPMDG